MAVKQTVILALGQDVNVTMDLTYDPESETPYTVNISVLNTAGEKFTLSGNPANPAAAKTTRSRKAG